MTQQRSVALDKIQIRYRISYLTWIRMQAWKRGHPISMSKACDWLLNKALDSLDIPTNPAVLLGLEEKGGG